MMMKKEVSFKDGVKDGLETWRHENGQKMQESTFKNGVKDGPETKWHTSGQKWFEVTYKDGRRDGLLTRWHENGQKSAEVTLKDGSVEGRRKWRKCGEPIWLHEPPFHTFDEYCGGYFCLALDPQG